MGVSWNMLWQGAVIWVTLESATQMTWKKKDRLHSKHGLSILIAILSESLRHLHIQVPCFKCLKSHSGLDLERSRYMAFPSSEKSSTAVDTDRTNYFASHHLWHFYKKFVTLPQPHTNTVTKSAFYFQHMFTRLREKPPRPPLWKIMFTFLW